MKTVILNTWNKETIYHGYTKLKYFSRYWQVDKSDFVTPDNWKEEEHDDIDLTNAQELAKEKKYLGTIELIDTEK